MVLVVSNNQDFLSSPDVISKNQVVIDIDEVTQVTENEEMTESTDLASQTSLSQSEEDLDEGESSLSASPSLRSIYEPFQEFVASDAGRMQQRRSSILKRRVSDALHIKESRGAWKCLPKPDMGRIRSLSESMAQEEGKEDSDKNKHQRTKSSVAFGTVCIRSYAQTLGDNPSVSYGPPISLDWEYEEHDAIQLDYYEDSRPPRRSVRQMILNYYHRKNLLTWKYGVSEEELKASKKQVKREQMQRTVTNTLLPIMHMEAALESAARKAKRAFSKKSSRSE